jgi:hypothetical protein
VCLEDAAKQLLAALPDQPPNPTLSKEDQQRLRGIFERLRSGYREELTSEDTLLIRHIIERKE